MVCDGAWRADSRLSPPTAGASPLHECGERPEDWCRDVATAAKCGALELCRLTAWDRALGVTVLRAGNAGGCRRRAHFAPEMAGEPQPAHPSISVSGEKMAKISGVPRGVHVECFWGGGLGFVCRDSTPMCPLSRSRRGSPVTCARWQCPWWARSCRTTAPRWVSAGRGSGAGAPAPQHH